MTILSTVNTQQADFSQIWGQLTRKLNLEGELLHNQQRRDQVRHIVNEVCQRRDQAIAEFTARFDGVELTPDQFRIEPAQMQLAHQQMDPQLLAALRKSIDNVRHYQQTIKVRQPADWQRDGVRLGVRYRPLNRVGVCVPGASAPLVSTVIMTVVPAQIAGVQDIAVISSPSFNGSIHPAVLAVCHELGVNDVYRISGAQAVAALAFGTDTIRRVDKIVGPSNWWGQLAKKEVFGLVDIDSFAGPSEVLIIADDSANPAWLASDMLSQAEHAPGSAVLLTDSQSLADQVAHQVDQQLAQLSRSSETETYIRDYSLTVVTQSIDEAIDLANEFAVEHLQVQCRDSNAVAERVINAGAAFVGHYSPVAVGDYFAGPSHTLPTGGSARFFSALNVNDFIKQTSVINYDCDTLLSASPAIVRIADEEGLTAHARSVSIRAQS